MLEHFNATDNYGQTSEVDAADFREAASKLRDEGSLRFPVLLEACSDGARVWASASGALDFTFGGW